ncbi:hypothetical protein INR49_032685 [Caranx melampygus]|nr:hypothetical protein INR49_032685 [Caranx melampygus]
MRTVCVADVTSPATPVLVPVCVCLCVRVCVCVCVCSLAPDMLDLLAYLHDPELVARFQRRCGLFPVEAAPRTRETSHAPPAESDKARGQLRGRWDHQDKNSNYEYKENGSVAGELCQSTWQRHSYVTGVYLVQGCSRPRYEVRNWLLHFLFLFSSGLGHEVSYITCLPCIHWNLDPFLCRRLVNMWTVVMYIGQVMKDVLKLPRPLSPPVVKLESRVDAEYGLPSTHAMAATAISFTFLLSAPSRIQLKGVAPLSISESVGQWAGRGGASSHHQSPSATPVELLFGLLMDSTESMTDVISGALISAVLLFLTFPYWETFDHFQLTSPVSPVVALALPLFLSYTYPELDHYSPTRGDTTTILGVGAGCSVGYWVNEQLGQTFEPGGPLPVPLPMLTVNTMAVGVARFLLGVTALVATRQIVKTASLQVLYSWYQVPKSDTDLVERRHVHRLDIVLEGGDGLLQQICTHFVVLHHAADLQLLDAIAHWDQFGLPPQKPVHADAADALLHLGHVRLVIPGLNVEQDGGLGDESWLLGFLGSIIGEPLLLDPSRLRTLFLEPPGGRTDSWWTAGWTSPSGRTGCACTSAGGGRRSAREQRDGVKHRHVSLRHRKALHVAFICQKLIERFETGRRAHVTKHSLCRGRVAKARGRGLTRVALRGEPVCDDLLHGDVVCEERFSGVATGRTKATKQQGGAGHGQLEAGDDIWVEDAETPDALPTDEDLSAAAGKEGLI